MNILKFCWQTNEEGRAPRGLEPLGAIIQPWPKGKGQGSEPLQKPRDSSCWRVPPDSISGLKQTQPNIETSQEGSQGNKNS